MRVIKRNNESEEVSFDKVLNRIRVLSTDLNVDYFDIAQKVCARIYDMVKTSDLDELAAHICSSMIVDNPDYGTLAARIIISNHQKNTSPSFSETISMLYNNVDVHGEPNPLVSDSLYENVMKNKEKLNNYIDYSRDFSFDYFGFKTLERSYLMKVGQTIVERPQHMFMRVALGIHGKDIKDALQTYDMMSKKYFTHATPTLFNSGTPRPQLSSCFLLAINGDSLDLIFDSVKECAMISKYSGGIGIHVHDVRAKGSNIRGTNGKSDGITPMLKVFNHTARYVNQCFTPETIVYTKNGIKRMDEVTCDDSLLTNDSSFRKVYGISINNVNKEILEIRGKYSFESVNVTPEHEIYVLKNQKKMMNYNIIKNRLEKNIIKPQFVLAKDIDLDDMVGYPIPSYEFDNGEYTNEFCRFYGLMIGDGHICMKTENSMEYGVTLNMESKQKAVSFVKYYLDKLGIHYWITEDNDKGSYAIRWSNKCIGITYEMLYDDEKKDKRIHPSFLHLPLEKTRSLVHGLVESDGGFTKEIQFHNTSYQVVMSLRYILLRMGILSSGCIHDNVGQGHYIVRPSGKEDWIENKKISYMLRIPKDKQLAFIFGDNFPYSTYTGYFKHENIIWSRIRSIDKKHYTGEVYDFNMTDNHNYTVSSLGVVHNSGKRNGSIAVYLEPWHADVFEFLELKKPHGSEEDRARDLFYAMWIPDLFMERVKANKMWSLLCPDQCPGLADVYGDDFIKLYEQYEAEGKVVKQVEAQTLWFKILESQIETGTPYILFKDACNKKSNQKNLGTIKSSNLCVAPETMILTDNGYHQIADLKDNEVKVWNGKEFATTVVKQTGRMQKLLTISFDNGMKIRCTPYHKFYIESGTRPAEKSIPIIIEAKDLNIGMRIIRYSTPTINTGTESLKYPYTQGIFAAEGTYDKYDESEKHQCYNKQWNNTIFCKRHQTFQKKYDSEKRCCAESLCDKPILWLYGEKKKLIQYVDWRYHNENVACDRLDVAVPHDIQEKYFVPMNYDLSSKIKWLEGYLDGDGSIIEFNGVKNIQVSSINNEFLTNVYYMLQTLGIIANISISQEKKMRMLPNGKGGKKEYLCETLYRLNIDCSSLLHLINLGFLPKRLNITNIRAPHHKTNKFVRISGIEDKDEYDDTYCFNEPKEHKGIFNGVLLGNCSEIVEYSAPDEIAVCNLASICLPTFIEIDQESQQPTFNFDKLHEISMIITKNLNKVIDVNFYPIDKARKSNLRHRPIGIGVQGLADAYIQMRYPFDSDEARALNKMIFETIYHGAVEQSMKIAKTRHNFIIESLDDDNAYLNLNEFDPSFDVKYPGAYATFDGSPASQGILQFDMWGVTPSDRYDWNGLKEEIMKYGMRNSLLLAPMPTASTSQIMGFNECFEPITSNLYKRKTMAGEFILVNRYLVNDLLKLGLWTKDIKNKIIIEEGSIQEINEIPNDIKALYKTVWEIKQKNLIDQAADRGAFIDQSQSMNLFIAEPDFQKLTSMHFYSWSKGLKTGCYYLRSMPKAKQQKFTVDPTLLKLANLKDEKHQPNKNEDSFTPQKKKTPPKECVPNEDGLCILCSS